jgi:hypothetical protein
LTSTAVAAGGQQIEHRFSKEARRDGRQGLLDELG